MSHELDDVQQLLPDADLRVDEVLRQGASTTVLRVRVKYGDGERRSVIVKRYHDNDEGRLRETAALASVPGSVRVPAIVAAGPAVLVLEDLGDEANVADALLGDDPGVATEALLGWADAIGELHTATRGSRHDFAAALNQPPHELPESWLPDRLHEAKLLLDRHAGALGVALPPGALDELTGLTHRLADDSMATLTPADACPDNNVRVGDRVVLIDFERAQWAHVAWDVAYLLVPWPTCWCSWALPADVQSAALQRYRSTVADVFPSVTDDGFASDVTAAAVGWSMLSAAFTLDFVLDADPDLDQPVDPGRPSPQRRALMQHRLRFTAGATEARLPALAEFAAGLHDALQHRWGDIPLPLAPAFHGTGSDADFGRAVR